MVPAPGPSVGLEVHLPTAIVEEGADGEDALPHIALRDEEGDEARGAAAIARRGLLSELVVVHGDVRRVGGIPVLHIGDLEVEGIELALAVVGDSDLEADVDLIRGGRLGGVVPELLRGVPQIGRAHV